MIFIILILLMEIILYECIAEILMEAIWENVNYIQTTEFTYTNVPSEFHFIQVFVLCIKDT